LREVDRLRVAMALFAMPARRGLAVPSGAFASKMLARLFTRFSHGGPDDPLSD
jgi:hypothetical protein